MKLKDGFLLRQVAGQTVVLPTGAELDLNMMITLNDTGAFLWQRLAEDTDEAALVSALLEEYDVDEETAKNAVCAFVKKLNDNGFLV
jgi:hypothetical protein